MVFTIEYLFFIQGYIVKNKQVWLQVVGAIIVASITNTVVAGGEVIARIATKDIAEGIGKGMTEGLSKEGSKVLSKEAIEGASKELAENISKSIEKALADAGIDITRLTETDLANALKNIGSDVGNVFKNGLKNVSETDLSVALKKSFDASFKGLGVDVDKVSLSIAKTDLEAFSKLQRELPHNVIIEIKEPEFDVEKQKLDQQYNEAQQEYAQAKKEYDAVKDNNEVLQNEREAALQKFLNADQKLKNVVETISKSEKFSVAERSWRATQRTLWTKRNYAGAFKSGGKFLVESLKQGLVMGLFFMVPGWGQQALESYGQAKALLNTIGDPQYVGNVWMQIPDELLNTDDPLNTVPLYVGIPTPSASTVDALKNGVRASLTTDYNNHDYFVTSGDYGFGKYALPSSPTAQMTHLNTGYDFYGDGSAVNKLVPMEQLLGQAGPQSREKTLVQNLAELAGKVQQGGIGKEVGQVAYLMPFYASSTKQSYQKPSPALAAVMRSATVDEAPSLLKKSIDQLQAEYKIGSMIIEPIKGFANDKEAQKALGAQANDSAPSIPYHAYNLFIYQTATTQLAKIARASAASGASFIYDYVIAIDKLGRYVPALIPLSTISKEQMTIFPAYGQNPAVTAFVSVIDATMTGIDGSSQGIADWTKLIKSDQVEAFNGLQPQLAFMKKLITTRSAQGPFTIGSYRLSIPTELHDLYGQGVWIYEVKQADGLLEGSTAGNFSDYLVALDNKFGLVQLPTGAATYFMSLVSSRVFTQNLTPVTDELPFSVIQYGSSAYAVLVNDSADWQKQAVTDKVTFALLFNASTPRYSLYMDYDINPYNLINNKTKKSLDVKTTAGGSLGLASQGFIPMRPQYAWSQLQMFLNSDQRISARTYLQDKSPLLASKVQSSYQQWRKYIVPLAPTSGLQGPFNFTNKLLENVRIQGTSLEDIHHGNYVYSSSSLPLEYLVVGLQPTLNDSSIGTAFNLLDPQPYLISLTTGSVYFRGDNNALALLKNDAGLPVTLNPQQLLAKVQRNQGAPFLSPLLKAITTSQQKYLDLRPDKAFFARFGLYIDSQDENGNSYIYQDVTTVPKQDYGNLMQAEDFFVCAQLGADGNATNIGKPLTGDTQIIISLVNGAIYDRKGYVGLIAGKDQVGFVSAVDSLSGSLPALRPAIRAEIKRRVDHLITLYEQERLAMQQARQKELPSLDSNIVAQLKNNDFLLPPYETLKVVGDTYYGFISMTVGSVVVEGIFDYTTGVLYSGDGKALVSYKGLLLDDMRRAVGISIDTKGNEKLGIPNNAGPLPLTDKDGNNACIPIASVQPNIESKIMVGTTRYEFFFNTVVGAYLAKVTLAYGNPYYLDLYGGYRFALDGHAGHSKAFVAAGRGSNKLLFTGENPDSSPWFFVKQQDGTYQEYQFKNSVTTANGEAFVAENTYLANSILVYQRIVDNTMTYSVFRQRNAVDSHDNIQFIFDNQYSRTGEADLLQYLRSSSRPPTGSDDYGTIVTSYDTSQDTPLLIVRSPSGAVKQVLMRMINSFDSLLLDATDERFGQHGEKLYTLINKDRDISFEFQDQSLDKATGGLYASAKDQDATMLTYFSYDNRPLMADALQQLQNQLKVYVIVDVSGVPQLVKTLSLNLKTVTNIQQVPDAVKGLADRVVKTAAFKYDPVTNRYLYQFMPDDVGKSYYRDGVAYVDLVSGILYFSDGKPVIIPLLPSQLLELRQEKHIGIPIDNKGYPLVGTDKQPYLVYA